MCPSGDRAVVSGWVDAQTVLYSSKSASTLPDHQLFTVRCDVREIRPLPLAQASAGCVARVNGNTLFLVVTSLLFVLVCVFVCPFLHAEALLGVYSDL